MKTCSRLLSVLLLALVLLPTLGRSIPAGAQPATEPPPGISGQAIRSGLFDAQAALLAGDPAQAAQGVADAQAAADDLLPLFTADPSIAPGIEQDLAAAQTAVSIFS